MARPRSHDDTQKVCTRCSTVKPLSEFQAREKGGNVYFSWCKVCGREYLRDRRLNDPAYRERYLAHKRASVITRHGISVERFEQMLTSQGGRCACCGDLPADGERLHIDHDHRCCPGKTSCGRCVRGLLCVKCNKGLGQFDDSVIKLNQAIAYLENTQ